MHLVVVEFNSHGGLIHYAYQLCTALAQQGIRVTLVTGSDYELQHFPHNFTVEPILQRWAVFDPASMTMVQPSFMRRQWQKLKWFCRRGYRALLLFREWLRLTTYLTRQSPDIVQFGMLTFPFEAFFLFYLRQKGLILGQICHEFQSREKQGIFAASVERLSTAIYNQFRVIFFHAKENKQRFLHIFPIKNPTIEVIPHGNEIIFLQAAATNGTKEDLRRRYSLEQDEQVCLFFGMLSPSKGLPDLLEAFSIVCQRHPAKLVIAGFPTKNFDMVSFQQQVSSLNLDRQVIVDPRYIPITSVAELFSMANHVVLPYRSGTQSGVLQTAYAFACPVVATTVGGLPEVIEDGKSGFLVPPHSPAKLAEKIHHLMQSPALAREMGHYCQQLSNDIYGWQPIARRILRTYNKILAQP